MDQESLWGTIRYYDIPLRRDTGHYNVMVLMPEKHNDPEEDELRRQQCMEVLSPAVSRLTDVLLLKDIHQNLILLSQNKESMRAAEIRWIPWRRSATATSRHIRMP